MLLTVGFDDFDRWFDGFDVLTEGFCFEGGIINHVIDSRF